MRKYILKSRVYVEKYMDRPEHKFHGQIVLEQHWSTNLVMGFNIITTHVEAFILMRNLNPGMKEWVILFPCLNKKRVVCQDMGGGRD